MEYFKIALRKKFAARLVIAAASERGWQAEVPNPERGKDGGRVMMPNPVTAETYLSEVLAKAFETSLLTYEARLHAREVEAVKRKELEQELKEGK